MKILISQHLAHEGPGYFAEFLNRHDIAYELIKVDEQQPLPKRIGDYAGLVFMGGAMSVNDDLPWIGQALALIREAVDADVPVLGHCLGAQLISKALGGEVKRNRVREIGWYPVRKLGGGAANDWFGRLPAEFEVFHWHSETFSIPPGATHVLQSQDCFHQAFVIGKTLALQCHVEMTADMVKDWAQRARDEIALPAATVQTADQMTADVYARVRELNGIAESVYTRWIQGLT